MKATLCKVPECPHFSRAVSGLCYAHRQKSPPESIREIIALPESARGKWSKQARLAQTSTMPVGVNGMTAESRTVPQTAEHASAAETSVVESHESNRLCFRCKLPLLPTEAGFCPICTSEVLAERDASRARLTGILVPQFEQPAPSPVRASLWDSQTWPAWVESIAVPVGVAGMLALVAALLTICGGK